MLRMCFCEGNQLRKAFLLGMAALILNVQDARAANGPTEQQWLSKLKESERSIGKNKAEYGEMLFAVGNFYHKQNNTSREQAMYDAAMKVFEQSPGKNSGILRFYSDALGRVYLEEGKYERAEPLFKRAVSLGETLPGKESTFVVPHTLGAMADMYIAQGRFPEAEAALNRRIQMRHRFINAGQVDVAKADLANLYTKWGKLTEAKSVIDELLTMPKPPVEVKNAVATYTAAVSKQTTR